MAAFATRISTLGGTVYHYFQAWRNTGMWVHLHRALYEQARRYAGRAACPSVVIMDGQSVKTTGCNPPSPLSSINELDVE
jgi:transposase